MKSPEINQNQFELLFKTTNLNFKVMSDIHIPETHCLVLMSPKDFEKFRKQSESIIGDQNEQNSTNSQDPRN